MRSAAPDRWLRFRIGTAAAALPLRIVREVLPRPSIVAVPGGWPALLGVTLARGLALPVYDLRHLFRPGGDPEAGAGRGAADAHLIVCDWGEVSIGVLGGAPDLLETGPAGSGPASAPEGGPAGEFAAARLERDGEVVTMLDVARVFASLGVPEDRSPDAREDTIEDDPAGR